MSTKYQLVMRSVEAQRTDQGRRNDPAGRDRRTVIILTTCAAETCVAPCLSPV